MVCHTYCYTVLHHHQDTTALKNSSKGKSRLKNWHYSRQKMAKMHFCLWGSLRGQAQVRPINKLDEAYTNADDRMMLVQHRSGDRVMR